MEVTIQEERSLDDIYVAVRCPRVDERVNRIVANLEAFDSRIIGKLDGAVHLIDASTILYIEAVDRRVFFYTTQCVYETDLRIYEAEDKLGSLDFVRVSKSMIVNFTKVRSIRPDFNARLQLVLENGERTIVSRQYATTIKKKIGAV